MFIYITKTVCLSSPSCIRATYSRRLMQKGSRRQGPKCKPETGWKASLSSSWDHSHARASPQLIKTEEKINFEKKVILPQESYVAGHGQSWVAPSTGKEGAEEGLVLKQRQGGEPGLLLLWLCKAEGCRESKSHEWYCWRQRPLSIPPLRHRGRGRHLTSLLQAELAAACTASATNCNRFKLLPFSHPPTDSALDPVRAR